MSLSEIRNHVRQDGTGPLVGSNATISVTFGRFVQGDTVFVVCQSEGYYLVSKPSAEFGIIEAWLPVENVEA